MQGFRTLRVWREAHALTLAVYRATSGFPKDELYGLTSQLRRAAAAVGANIAEGCGSGGRGELGRYLRIACGSASELECHLQLALDLNLVDHSTYCELDGKVRDVRRMLAGFMRRLKAATENG
jgi:four helix bundle protein